MMLKTLDYWKEKGFIDEPIEEGIDLKKEIRKMCEEKNAIILAHYYTVGEIQDIADFIGDSLALARKAAETDAKIMVIGLGCDEVWPCSREMPYRPYTTRVCLDHIAHAENSRSRIRT